MVNESIFVEVVFAAIGGLLVVIGLLMEHFGDMEWYEYKCLPEGRSKCIRYCGEWLVIIGVGIEVGVAVKTAIQERVKSDAWTEQMADAKTNITQIAKEIVLNTANGRSLSNEWCMVTNNSPVEQLQIGPLQEGSYELEARFLVKRPFVEDPNLKVRTVTCWLSTEGADVRSQEQEMGNFVDNRPAQIDKKNLFGNVHRSGFTPLDSYEIECEQRQKFWVHVLHPNTYIIPVISRPITNNGLACLKSKSWIKATRMDWNDWQ